MLSATDAALVRRAFLKPDPNVRVENGRMLVRDRVVATAPDGATLSSPSSSADGREVAWIERSPDHGNELHVQPATWWDMLRNGGNTTIWSVSPIQVASLSPDGHEVAYATRTEVSRRSVRTSQHSLDGHLPVGVRAQALCCLPDGRVAIETKRGTCLMMEEDGRIHDLPWTDFSEMPPTDARLDQTTQATLHRAFGPRVAETLPSPDGRRVLARLVDGTQVTVDRERVHVLGQADTLQATWSPDGRFVACDLDAGPSVWLDDGHRKLPESTRGMKFDGWDMQFASGHRVSLKTLFPAWDVDLGAHTAPAGDIDADDQSVHINGVRIK